jgi:hypothetical protein
MTSPRRQRYNQNAVNRAELAYHAAIRAALRHEIEPSEVVRLRNELVNLLRATSPLWH